MEITFTKLFTYWIVTWFLIYYFISNKIPSPKMALCIGLLQNIFGLFSFIYTSHNLWNIFKFLMVIFFTKALPLYLVRNVPFDFPKDIYVFIGIFGIYCIHLQLLGTNVIEVYREAEDNLTKGKNNTPLYKLIDWLQDKLYK